MLQTQFVCHLCPMVTVTPRADVCQTLTTHLSRRMSLLSKDLGDVASGGWAAWRGPVPQGKPET